MNRKWFALAVMALVLGSLNGCCFCNRPGLLARIRGQSATPYTDPCCPTSMPSYPMMFSNGTNGNGACCNGSGPMMFPGGGGFGTTPGVIEQLPGQFPGITPSPPPSPGSSAPGEAKPLPAGPSGDMAKGTRTGRVTTLPDLK